MKYICLGYLEPGKFENMSESERNTVLDECFSYNDELRKNGHLVAEMRAATREIRKFARNASALSEARFRKSVKSGEVLCARSIEPFEGRRWRLRRMRASGCTDLTAMGIESFFVCSLLILLGLGKSDKTENRS
jgi:hypothetical protein